MTVKEILDEKGRDVVTASEDITVADAGKLLAKHKIGAVVVVDTAGKICGILSERDIVRAIATDGASVLEQPVTEVMTAQVRVCGEHHSVDQVMEIMTTGRFRHLPVETDGKIGGMVSIGDVVRARIQQVEREAEEIKAYIAS